MMPAKARNRFHQSRNIRYRGFILVGCILGSCVLYAVQSVAKEATPSNANATSKAGGRSMGESLLETIVGADALKPCPGSAPPCSSAKEAEANVSGSNQNSTPVVVPVSQATPLSLAQARTFPDIQGNWARSFIEALAARDVIRGFPDGTFRPDEPVTRAQFAAMIRKAFPQAPIRAAVQFADVPPNYWGYTAIQEAYQTGFLEGYPNRVFLPNQNIPRVQVLVSLATGLNLNPTTASETILNTYFQDAAQIPGYARDRIAASTENGIVVNYPNVALFNSNRVATRAEVAAFIYQALVRAGQAPPLNASDVASRYIVGYQPPIAQPPAPPTAEQLQQGFLLPEPPVVERFRRALGGASSISTPTAFGADRNQGFVGFSFQSRARFTNQTDGGIALGFGVGDAEKLVGLEGVFSSYSTIRSGFAENYGISFKAHRLLSNDLGVAVGVENAIIGGNPDPNYTTVYGVVSKIFPLGSGADFDRSVTVSAGLGGGRFRSEADVVNGEGGVNVFGSVGVRFVEPLTLIADWTGQDLNLGVSIFPFRNFPLVITPGVADVTGRAGDGPRFILGVGYGITF